LFLKQSVLPQNEKESLTMRVGDSFCPGILHAVPAKDGLLIRIRMPGGVLIPQQLEIIAELSDAYADGQIEITSRANLQLRGIKAEDLSQLVQGFESAGCLPSRQHDRVRNIVTSPFAGLAPDEILDSRSFVRELDDRLIADTILANLLPKFNFAIDGGGTWFSRDGDDLALRAVMVNGVPLFHLAIGGALSGFGVGTERALDCLLEAARMCLQISKKLGVPARGRNIVSRPEALTPLLNGLSRFLVHCPEPTSNNSGDTPTGIYSTKRVGFVSVVPSVPLGRLTCQQARGLASIAKEWGGDLRLAPWRGILLSSIPDDSVGLVSAKLKAVNLSLDGKDGYQGVSACAGSDCCDASLANVRRDAVILAAHLSGREPKPGWTVNISGCEKQCAMRTEATAKLVATPNGYNLMINKHFLGSGYSFEAALDAMLTYQAEMPLEVSSCQ
jgi:precorrin-3B synthase